jgi:hypothetical protein
MMKQMTGEQSRRRSLRRAGVLGSLALGGGALVSIAACWSDDTGQVLYLSAGWDSVLLGWVVAWAAAGLGSIAITFAALEAHRRAWRALSAMLVMGAWCAVVAVGILGFFFNSSRVYTSVAPKNDRHEVVALEDSFVLAGELYEQTGWVLTPIATFSSDDGYKPFAAGDYEGWWTGDVLRIEYDLYGSEGVGLERITADLR